MIEIKKFTKENKQGIEIKEKTDRQLIKVLEKGNKPIIAEFKTREIKEEKEENGNKRQSD